LEESIDKAVDLLLNYTYSAVQIQPLPRVFLKSYRERTAEIAWCYKGCWDTLR